MPTLIHRNISLKSDWTPDQYWLWTPKELHERWANNKALEKRPDLIKLNYLIVVNCDYEEAPFIAAMYLREVHDMVDETYYDVEAKKLYLYYGGKADLAKKEEDKESIIEEAKNKAIEVVNRTLFKDNMLSIRMDRYGARLFKREFNNEEAMAYA